MKSKALSQSDESKTHGETNGSSPNDHPFTRGVNGRVPLTEEELYQELNPTVPERLLPTLPTYPLSHGWRTIYDEETDKWYNIPLTLSDILFPTEDDVGAIYMTHSMSHDQVIRDVVGQLDIARSEQSWYFPSDVLMIWHGSSVPSISPDITLIPEAASVEIAEKDSFKVGIDGPMPRAVIEVTSKSTRTTDFGYKVWAYAAAGVEEYLIIDIRNQQSEPWQLHGFRLGASPDYEPISPDAEGGITLQSVDVRFVPIERQRVDLFDGTTGERLRSGVEFAQLAHEESTRADSEAARADSEAARADSAEATIEELQARVRELEAAQTQNK